MSKDVKNVRGLFRAFLRDEAGGSTIEFVIVFMVFMTFFLMIIESGIYSVRHVMLERGVDLAVRDVRIGRLADPEIDELRDRICERTTVIPNCEQQLGIELIVRDPRNLVGWPAGGIKCTNRGSVEQPTYVYDPISNNQLAFIRACARFDPIMPTTGLGKAIVEGQGTNAGAEGSYALVAVSAFVVEPFKKEDDDGVSSGGSGS